MLVELYSSCLRIRMVEETIADRYSEQQMRCPTHLSIGQELVGGAAGLLLNASDYAVSTHRSHAHYLGKGGNLDSMIAELYGKASGCSRGRGGSMHLIDLEVGFEGSTAIVSNSIPVGVGLAKSITLNSEKRVSVIFVGEAVFETGVFFESLNLAATWSVPAVFICENNLYSVYSPLRVRQPVGRDRLNVVEEMGIYSRRADGTSAQETLATLDDVISYSRQHSKPSFVEVSAYRWREHCGPNFDNDIGYRSQEEFTEWRSLDFLERLEADLLSKGEINEESLSLIKSRHRTEIDSAFQKAILDQYPPKSSACDYEFMLPK